MLKKSITKDLIITPKHKHNFIKFFNHCFLRKTHIQCLRGKNKLLKSDSGKHLPVQFQHKKHQKKVRNVFKFDKKKYQNDVTDIVLVSFLLTLNIIYSVSIVDSEHVFVCWDSSCK